MYNFTCYGLLRPVTASGDGRQFTDGDLVCQPADSVVFVGNDVGRCSHQTCIERHCSCALRCGAALRFIGVSADRFFTLNQGDLVRVQNSLIYLVHGTNNFAERICAVLYDQKYKLGAFGRFCALELVGTLKPEQAPPINGRMAKALRFLGFDVRAT